jgi:hypothetical protein
LVSLSFSIPGPPLKSVKNPVIDALRAFTLALELVNVTVALFSLGVPSCIKLLTYAKYVRAGSNGCKFTAAYGV